LLTLLWLLAVAAVLIAVAAHLGARRAARRLERLSESYWELRYEAGQLKSRVARLEAAAGLREPDAEPTRPAATTTFVPLSSLKK
jgi:hypothetical protein